MKQQVIEKQNLSFSLHLWIYSYSLHIRISSLALLSSSLTLFLYIYLSSLFFFLPSILYLILEEADSDVLVGFLQLVSEVDCKTRILHCESIESGCCPELQLDYDLLLIFAFVELFYSELCGICLLAEGSEFVEAFDRCWHLLLFSSGLKSQEPKKKEKEEGRESKHRIVLFCCTSVLFGERREEEKSRKRYVRGKGGRDVIYIYNVYNIFDISFLYYYYYYHLSPIFSFLSFFFYSFFTS